jgi:plastocyanin
MTDAPCMRNRSILLALCLLLLPLAGSPVSAEGDGTEFDVTLTVIFPDGSESTATIPMLNDTNGWNASVSGFDAIGVDYNHSDNEWGVMLHSIDNQASTADWGALDFWFWGLYTVTADGVHEMSMVGASDLELADGDHIVWFATSGAYGPGECTVDVQIADVTTWNVNIATADGTEVEQSITNDGCTEGDAWTASQAAFDAMGLTYNASQSDGSVMLNSIDGASSDAEWGALDYWWWGLYEQNSTTEAWDIAMASISDLSAEDGEATFLWAPTFDGALVEDFPAALSDAQEAQAWAESVTACEAADHQIGLGEDGLSFSQNHLEIAAGESVCWSWQDASMDHNVVEVEPTAGGFSSGETAPSLVFIHTFSTNGTYEYHCEPHSTIGMTGTIQVGPLPVAPSSEGGDTPGFTLVLATLALLGAAFTIRRKA